MKIKLPMVSIKFPLITKSWAFSVMIAFVVSGIAAAVIVSSKEKQHQSINALITTPLIISQSKEVKLNEKIPPLTVSAKDESVLPLEETVIKHIEDFSISPKEKAAIIDISKVVKIPSKEKLREIKAKNTPYYNYECIEKKKNGDLLPIESPSGSRPFDVYQSEFLFDSSKTQLIVVISELGANPSLFNQVRDHFPRKVTCAFLANKSSSQKLNNIARELGHETLLMIPMEPVTYPKSDPGMWTLLTNLPKAENVSLLEKNLSQFTGYIGVIPYMGNRFSRVKRDFQPILSEIKKRGLAYFEPRFIRSKAEQLKPVKALYIRANYDIIRGISIKKIKKTLAIIKKDLDDKKSVVLTVQADSVNLDEVQKWLPKAIGKDVVLAPLSAMVP